MQLNKLVLSLFLLSSALILDAQNNASEEKIHLDDVSVDFLFNYYSQDGIHSPVTGGRGTEELTNIAPSIIVNIPIDTVRSINFSGGIDYYTSASSDNINNPFLRVDHVSSASAADSRVYSNVGFKQKNKSKKTSYSANLGMSFEFDVTSISIGAGYSKLSKDENKEFAVKGSYYFDNWKLIFPVEHRNGSASQFKTNLRHSFNLSLIESWVINKRMSASVNLDLVLQNGLLSTPFHRVYFDDFTNDLLSSNVEKLPDFRFKLPVGLRYNYYVADFMIFNAYYRFYWDTWDVIGNTFQLDVPLKLTNFMRVYPFYRFHHQTEANYFAPFAEHAAGSEFYTSDFDLSGFMSHKVGLGIGFSPLNGLFNFQSKNKKRTNLMKSLDLRYAYYIRSDGLKANLFSLGINYLIKR